MGQTKNTGHLAHLVQYDASNNITIPAGLKVNGGDDVMTNAAMTSTLGGYVPTSRIITINGTAYDLSADRAWNIAAGLTSFNTRTGAITLTSADVTGALGFTPSANNHTHAFADITAKPTTLAGYGITDAASSTHNHDASYVPVGRTITINGTSYDLSANRSWTVSGSDSTKLPLAGGTLTGVVTFAGSTRFPDTDGTINSLFGIYGWGTQLQFTKRNVSTDAYEGTAMFIDYNGLYVQSDYSFRSPQFRFTNSSNNAYFTGNSDWGVRLVNDNGYIQFGPANGSWTHIYSDKNFYFNQNLYVNGTQVVTNAGTWSISISGNSATTSQRDFNYLRVNSNDDLYLDYNHGQSIVGVYSSYRYQGVFSMGNAYKLPKDGTSTGNLYGMAWSHPNAGGVASNLNTHGLLVMENGTFLAAVSGSIRARDDMRAPIFYDSNNTGYYLDPNGTSYLYYIQMPHRGNGTPNIRVNEGNEENWRAIHVGNANFGIGISNSSRSWSGRESFAFHVDASKSFRVHSDGWDSLFEVWGSSGYARLKGSFEAGGDIWLGTRGTWLSSWLNQSVTTGAAPTFGEVYNNGWFRNYGDTGLYQQSHGGHFQRNVHSSYGTWSIHGGAKNGYSGLNIIDPSGYWNNYMHESGSGGLYSQNYRGDWVWYHNAPNNCTAFNGSSADGGVRVRVNGSMRVTQDFNPQGYTGFGGNVEWANGSTQYHGSNTAYNWRDWGGWGGYWWSRNGGDMIMNLYALYSVTGSISDMRYKKDVEALPYGLNEIMQLNPIKYHYNLPKESMLANDPDYFLGFSAQEVQALIPEAVHEKIGEDVDSLQGMLTITYDELVPVTVQAIKEQQVMIHNQNIRIQKLEALVSQLQNN